MNSIVESEGASGVSGDTYSDPAVAIRRVSGVIVYVLSSVNCDHSPEVMESVARLSIPSKDMEVTVHGVISSPVTNRTAVRA